MARGTSGGLNGNIERQEMLARKGGRRMTIMILFLVNAVMISATYLPWFSAFFAWFVEDYPDVQLMLKGIIWVVWSGANVVGWWAAKMGD